MSWLYTARDFRWNVKKWVERMAFRAEWRPLLWQKFVKLLIHLAKDISYFSEKIQRISETFGCGDHVCRFEPAAMEIQ